MLEGDDVLFARFADSRPGRTLLTVENAALPVTVVTTDVLAQERKPLPLLNEFALRFVQANVCSVGEIAAITGLDGGLVGSAIADEVSSGNLTYRAANQRIALTPQGQRVCQELEAVQPVQKQLRLPFDRLTWRLADYSREEMRTKREAEESGDLLLPAARTARIGPDEVTVPAINSLLRGSTGSRSSLEVLVVRKIRPSTHRYLPVKLLVYGDPEGGEVELSVVVDHEVSPAHDLALAKLGGVEKLGITVAPPTPRPTLTDELEALRVAVDPTQPPAPHTPHEEGVAEAAAPLVRGIGVLEHRQLLDQALTTARRRLLLISPWVKAAVVDTTFLGHLEQRLRQGCAVHLAHGYGDDDRGSDAKVLDKLRNLQRRFQDRFTLARLRNTHAKILIFDDTWVSTSFNWLSFRGDPDRTYRMEEGTLVQIPDQVSAEYERYVKLINEQRVD